MTGVIQRFGVFGVFVLMIPESACVPLPSEVTLLFSGFAVRERWMSFPLAVLAATAGNLVGSLLAYWLGASSLLDRIAVARRVLARWEGLLAKQGTRAVFFARLLPVARTFVSLPAGTRGVRLIPFVMLTTAGCALWAGALILAGVVAGTAWTKLDFVLGQASLAVALGAIAVAGIRNGRRRGHLR